MIADMELLEFAIGPLMEMQERGHYWADEADDEASRVTPGDVIGAIRRITAAVDAEPVAWRCTNASGQTVYKEERPDPEWFSPDAWEIVALKPDASIHSPGDPVGWRVEGPIMGVKYVIGRVVDVTVRLEPSYEQLLSLNDYMDTTPRRATVELPIDRPLDAPTPMEKLRGTG